MSKVLGPSAFLNEFGVKNERVRILYLLDRHGGEMTLGDVIDASAEPQEFVVRKVVGFVDDGLVTCGTDLNIEHLDEHGEAGLRSLSSSELELTDRGRTLLKYA